MEYTWKLDKSKKIALADYDPRHSGDMKKADAEALFEKLNTEIGQLQELCYAASHNSVLIVLQGMDTSGKDGTVSHVMGQVNPQGCQVTSFKSPTPEELSHDFLWRIHQATPAKGMMEIFNRSHYENVLVVRVHNLAPPDQWEKYYEQINQFEKLLADNGTIIIKFFLHISKDEQAVRLKAREDDQDKRWKLSAGDYVERRFWEDYQAAYQELLGRCSTKYAPWYIVPADRKWFRNLAVAQTIVEALRPYRSDWEQELRKRGQIAYDELLKAREQGGGGL